MKEYIHEYRKAVNPPYSRRDIPILVLTFLILVLPLFIIVLTRQTSILGSASNFCQGTPAGCWSSSSPQATPTPTQTPTQSNFSGGSFTPTSSPNTPTPTQSLPTPTVPPVETTSEKTILDAYILNTDPPNQFMGNYYDAMKYRPRQFLAGHETGHIHFGGVKNGQPLLIDNPGKYAGWDLLNMPNDSVVRFYSGSRLVTLRLNRPAQTAIVWRGPSTIPTWLKSWTKGESVVLGGTTTPTYTKLLPVGNTDLGGIYDSPNQPASLTYLVLLSEQNGKPSAEPSVPSGKEKPLANQTCPSWLHDSYTTTGPDGKTYPTWHPAIDPVYWCYYLHEHGANPENFKAGYRPSFEYVAYKDNPTGEGHAGFKIYVFDDNVGRTWIITHHFGTASTKRYCARFHTFEMAVKNKATNEILADIHLMGDFGKSVANTNGDIMTPVNCPNQADGVGGRVEGFGEKKMIVADHKNPQGSLPFYEPWVMGARGNILGLKTGFHFNTVESNIVICDTLNCANPITYPNNSGSNRFFADISLLGLTAGYSGGKTGTFYTDPMATKILASDDAKAVKQYVKPGINLTLPSGYTVNAVIGWNDKYVMITDGNSRRIKLDRERSLKPPN